MTGTETGEPGPRYGREDHRRIERFLGALRDAHEHMAAVFEQGCCYELSNILRQLYPEAEPWKLDGHVYTRIGGRFYDIRGQRVLTTAERARAVPRFERRDPPHRWRSRVREQARGFRPRQQVRIHVTWQVRWLRRTHRTWRSLRFRAWRIANALRIVHRIAEKRGPSESPAVRIWNLPARGGGKR